MKLSVYLLFASILLGAQFAAATPKPEITVDDLTQKEHSGDSEVAIFAGGCFWCMEPPFDKVPGVKDTVSGYIGGHVDKPSYQQVTSGTTGHYEAVKVVYDARKISYERLLEIFWQNVDPVDDEGQFCDKGEQYLSAIFVLNDEQRRAAKSSLAALQQMDRFAEGIATEVLPASEFFAAEQYHQNYYQKNPLRYRFYRSRCGRDDRLQELWGKHAGG